MPATEPAPVSLVLASRSPARLATLAAAGVTPRVVVSDVDEPAVLDAARAGFGGDLDPADAVLVLAQAKAEAVSRRLEDDEAADELSALVLGCDSMLELDGEVVGKPADAADARARWRSMRGRAAVLHTGHWLVDLRDDEDGGTRATFGASSATTVHFADVDDDEIDAYVATGEPLHVAGAFTIDGLGGPYVDRIEGDHHGVVGLSLPLLRELLGELGVPWRSLRDPR
ncbi:Maf family nucleotide pyrophosphatase [Isoptericola sp. 4D.3]|uniref:Nucleoside triphosphate pyrophosphatase n=1 Tax=Isoptericola peretonis TaxID=2918523 RepID=A0ABT0IY71_9MICO|nr:Maf family nucleotide pyrophosphatase [Isoptericola sp. 4D.3]